MEIREAATVPIPTESARGNTVAPAGSAALVELPREAPAIRVLIAEPETIYRESLGFVLQLGRGFEVVASCSDGAAVLACASSSQPDVLLLDSRLSGREDGVDLLRELKRMGLAAKVVLLCPAMSRDEMIAFMRLGTRGIVLNSEPTETLVQCLHKVARGEYWLGNNNMADVIQALCDDHDGKPQWENKYRLTRREIEIVEVVLQGCSNREIAASLSVSEHTVKHHLSSIFDKLGVYSRLELALFALNHDLDSK